MNHKRRRAKNRRAGCLLCKPHKGNGMKGRRQHEPLHTKKSRADAQTQLSESVLAHPSRFEGRLRS